MALRVLVVDEQEPFREAVRELLRDEAEIVGEAVTGAQGVHLADALRPDLVLLDIRIAGLDSIRATHRIKALAPETKVVLLTAHAEEAYLCATGKTGADALLPKRLVKTELVPAVRALAAGRPWEPWPSRDRRWRPVTASEVADWDGSERRDAGDGSAA